MDNSIVHSTNRVLYVEPNDIYGHIDGSPLTPDYTDYCISMNLIAEVVSRYKQSGEDATKRYIMTWTSRPKVNDEGNGNSAGNWISFLHGEDAKLYGGDGNVLTTYYTDINYDDIVKKNILEGIGISSIQVSFETYYTPTVVIKFIDVHGASLFGREEAVHESGEDLTLSSVFGVFFTVPYPKFKLQIKGFYGHAVTYQLTCSNFRASFNSQTGNFEAVATFIGYSYSLLTDIPLRYLVAAPYCNYVGRSYWEEKLHSSEWALSDGSTPQRLLEIIEKIKSLTVNTEDVKNKLMTDDDSIEKENVESERSKLTELSAALKDYVNAFTKLNRTSQSLPITEGEEDNEQLVIFAPSNETSFKIVVGETVQAASARLLRAFESYNDSYPNKKFSNSLFPNGKPGEFRASDKIEFGRICKITTDSDGQINKITFNCTEQTEKGIMGIRLNNKLIYETAHRILTDAYNEKGMIPSYFGEFCYVVNLNKFLKKIAERIRELNVKDKEIDKRIAEKMQTAAKFSLGFTPYIGDIFKIIMCHLETFMHMMWGCYRVIDDDARNNRRTPDVLGIDLSKTDIAVPGDKKQNTIPAWVGVFNNGSVSNEGGDEDKSIESIAWVGDFSHNFEEEKLVIELYKAAQVLAEKSKTEVQPISLITGVPVMPNDLNNMASVFAPDIKNGISGLSGYLSFRAAQIFGILINDKITPEFARYIGIMDAYNYFGYSQSRSDIKNTLIEPTSNKGSLADIMFAVAHCEKPTEEGFYGVEYQETGRSIHDFETVRGIMYQENGNIKNLDRHPMFVKNGQYSKYVHYYRKNWVGMVPDNMKSYNLYEDTFEKLGNGKNDTYFIFKRKTDISNATDVNGFLHKSNTKTLFEGLGNEYYPEDYVNNEMFSININEAFSESVIKEYEELKSGTFIIYGDTFNENLNSVLEKLWHVSDTDYGEFFGDNQFMLSSMTADRGITQKELYPRTQVEADMDKNAPLSIDNDKIFSVKDGGIKYNPSKNSWVTSKNEEKPLANLCVRFLQSNYLNGASIDYESLFASAFYYHQNDIVAKTEIEKDKENGKNVMRTRQSKVKALIFLHSLKYDYKKIAGFLNPDKKNGGIYSIPYGYLLLLGGLLWREKYYMSNGVDPIQTLVDKNARCEKYDVNTDKIKTVSTENSFKEVKKDFTLFREVSGRYILCPLRKTDVNAHYNVRVSQLFGMGNSSEWMPDQYVTNALIHLFEKFVSNEWGKLVNGLELKNSVRIKNGAKKGRYTIDYSGETFLHEASVFVNDFKNDKKPVNMLKRLRNRERYFDNFLGNYRFISINKSGHILMLLDEENTTVQDILKDVYTRRAIVTDSSGIRHVYNAKSDIKEISIDSNIFKSYLQGFENKLKEIVNNERAGVVNEYGGDDVTLKKDLLIPEYLHLKMIWDKWMVSATTKKMKNGTVVNYEDYYNVENFYKSFVFIDAFYKNIYKKFLINLETLKKSYVGRDEDGSLFQFIGDITSAHNCLFLALPDYIDMGSIDNDKAKQGMMNMFKPVPYSEMNDVDNENRFVIIYTPRMSEIPSSMNGYKSDYFKIWNPATNTWADKVNEMFSLGPVNDGGVDMSPVTRYGYYVPSFGVAFSRQNNHLFKSINVDMSTPLVTSASINATANIAKRGSGGQNKVAFIGQDLYPVFSNYSYICEIEMMGDAQIQPLMYFQLMNVPMWNGVYMIFNVTHMITAGNMITKFKGMKISRNPLPYNSSWYMFNPDGNSGDPFEENGSFNNMTSILKNSGTYKKFEGTPPDHFGERVNYASETVYKNRDKTRTNVDVSSELKTFYNCLYEEIKMYQEQNDGGKMTWNVGITSVGQGNHVKESQHYSGYAIDLQLLKLDGNRWYVDGGETKTPDPRYFIVMDILFSLHFNEIHQVIYECYEKKQYYDPTTQYRPKVLHVGLKEEKKKNTQFYVADENYKSFKFDKNILLPEFKVIAAKYYNLSKGDFRTVFTNFNGMLNSDIASMLRANDGSQRASDLNGSSLKNISYVKKRLWEEFKITDIQFCGVAGNFVQESAFNPTAQGNSSPVIGGKGIAQWTDERRIAAEKKLGKPLIKATLEEQVDYLIYELKNTEKAAMTALKNTYTVSDAVDVFQRKFERAGKPVLDKRIAYGNLVYDYIKSGQIT